ncbi:hypothetical protein Ccrd_021765 [Cynara cardunculus var. scolymus]|uniref:Uncharacterized protein n=1 Tax=Cynara cardunculus var. scolymus TaxID=59895 RepID=A0A103Y018_CYNCS|nr:hypothetical protein Ccrd_021765 [Cynara cardunculus var. scolymus]
MKLASIIQNGMHPSIKFDVGLLNFASSSTSTQFPKWVHLQFTHSPNLSFDSAVCRNRWPRKLSIVRSKGVEQEEFSSSERETSSSNSYIDNAESKSHLIIDNDSEEKTKDLITYKTSARTVALCVLSAVAFGVGLGLKDGIGKASEFFAGYLLEQSLSVDNLFVFVLVFKYFKVPLAYQLFSAGDDDEEDLSDNFIVKTCQKIIPLHMMAIDFLQLKMELGKFKVSIYIDIRRHGRFGVPTTLHWHRSRLHWMQNDPRFLRVPCID